MTGRSTLMRDRITAVALGRAANVPNTEREIGYQKQGRPLRNAATGGVPDSSHCSTKIGTERRRFVAQTNL